VRTHVTAGFGAAGLLALLVGTFLPWLRSGETQRNSYQAGGALHRLLRVHGLSGAGLDVWPYIGLWCAAVVAVHALGYPRWAAAGGFIAGAVALAVSIGALMAKDNGYIGHATPGPVVTIFGACIVLAAATLLLLPGRAGPAHREQP
jgi:hypothetical protein